MALIPQGGGGGPSNSVSREGSHTVLAVQAAEQRDASAAASELGVGLPPAGALHLRGAPRGGPHVAWDEQTVDNEGLGRKKSKICCIYHRPRRLDESSDEDSSDSESGSDDGTAKPNGHCHRHWHHVDGEGEGDRHREPEDKRRDRKDDRNAYERMSPHKGKGKSN